MKMGKVNRKIHFKKAPVYSSSVQRFGQPTTVTVPVEQSYESDDTISRIKWLPIISGKSYVAASILCLNGSKVSRALYQVRPLILIIAPPLALIMRSSLKAELRKKSWLSFGA